jgi:16S rRNA C1402 N4-methylase RsmH
MSYSSSYHAPVMVEEVLDQLRPERGGMFLDGTLGGADTPRRCWSAPRWRG